MQALGFVTPLVAALLAAQGYVVVLVDGGALVAEARPLLDAERGLAYATLADGTLVSFPERRIDWDATERRNRAAARPAGPAQAPVEAVSGSLPERPVEPRTPLAITNRTIESYRDANPPQALAEAGRAVPSGTLSEEPPRALPAIPEPRPELDDEGNSAAYWRERARSLRLRRREAEFHAEAARRALEAERSAVVYGRQTEASSGGTSLRITQYGQTAEERAVVALRLSELEERLRHTEAGLAAIREEEGELREQARKAGALASWLR